MSSSTSDSSDNGDALEVAAPRDNLDAKLNLTTNRFKCDNVPNISNSFYTKYSVGQYAQCVVDFSSQYGSDFSISYTASNITGRPSKYPEYGDFPETFAMRTYGEWWDRAPSYKKDIQTQNLPKIPVDDFIVIQFEEYVIPEEIYIFETFCPGGVVGIWAYTVTKTWVRLWEQTEAGLRTSLPNSSRKFSPPLRELFMPTNTIRLDFNHSRLGYFTEIDAVLLCGKTINLQNMQNMINYIEGQQKGSILRKLENMQFHINVHGNYQSRLNDFLRNDLEKFLTEGIAIDETSTVGQEMTVVHKEFDKSIKPGLKDMPFEILLYIFSYLDLISLFRVGQVSCLFYDVSINAALYSEVNLRPYWHLVTTDLLCTLAKRATLLKKFDLSWCGLFNSISPTEFKKFIQQRGDTLSHLRLNSCKFLNATCIETLGIVCDNLKELSLRNCFTERPIINFSCLANLKNLERLDLFCTIIEPDLLLTMLENNRKLKHLNLAFSGVRVNMDDIAEHLGSYNQELVSLDIWKSHYLSAMGIQALSKCQHLEEIDFGWCLREALLGDSLMQLIINCPKLKKLFLAAVRGITDREMECIANFCPNLEQLDLMGILGISTDRYHDVLLKCKKLSLLDLSFCDNIDDNLIGMWMRVFKVEIKHNYMPVDFRY